MKRTSRKPSTLSESLQRRLNAYALAASAAGVGVAALAQPANAKIIYRRVHHVVEPGRYYHLDLVRRGSTDFTLVNSAKRRGESTTYFYSLRQIAANGNSVMGYYAADHTLLDSALESGRRIEPRLNFFPGSAGLASASVHEFGTRQGGPWANVKNRYLGLKFMIKGKAHYGWARMSVKIRGAAISATLTGYAYETVPNKGIIAGKTRGPDVITAQTATLGTLALGWK